MNITIISDASYITLGNHTVTMAKALKERGHRVSVILPFYETIYSDIKNRFKATGSYRVNIPQGEFNIDIYQTDDEGVNYYFLANSRIFAREKTWGYHDDALRSCVFCTAALNLLLKSETQTEYIITDTPNTALVPVFIKFKYNIYSTLRNAKTFHCINTNHYGIFDRSTVTSVFGIPPEEKHLLLCNNEVNLTKAAIICSSRVFIGENALDILYDQRNDIHHTAVQFGFKIRKLRAGIDYSTFSPETDSDIHKMFSATSINCKVENKLFVQRYLYLKENADIPLVALYPDTNKDIYTMYIRELIRCDIQLILISNNISHSTLKSLPDKCVCIRDNSAETLKNVFSASDICVFGGFNSPCGNPAYIAAAYGCVPVLPYHRFFDHGFTYFNKLTLEGNGFTIDPQSQKDLLYSLWDVLAIYRHDKKTYYKLLQNTMKKVFSATDCLDSIEKEAEKTVYSFI